MAIVYYPMLALGGAFVVIGTVVLILVVKFLRNNRMQYIITALVILIGGVGIVVILIAFVPSPQAQGEYISQMLSLSSARVQLLTINNWNNEDDSVIEIKDKQLLKKWASVLQACQSFNPNHPRYKEKYLVILYNDGGDRFLYEVNIDEKTTDTADLWLLKKFEIGSNFYYLGSYRCDGLFEFISPIAARINK